MHTGYIMDTPTELDYIQDDEVLNELSLSNLKNNVNREFGRDREVRSNRIKVINYEAIPSVGSKELLLKARIVGEEGKYQVSVRFTNIRFSDTLAPGFAEVTGLDGVTYFVRQTTLAQTSVKVKCNCLDFYWRFATWNHGRKSLEGDPPPPYVKLTDRPPVNPNKVPGACKHILKFMTFIKNEGIAR